MRTLDKMENMFGSVSEEIKEQIMNYIENPTVDNWDDIHCIIINSSFKTVWQAVLEIDPTFPSQGRSEDIDENIVSEWERIPSPFEVVRAISEAV